MAKYFNTSNESFKDDSTCNLYVDKTGLIAYTNKALCAPNRCLAVSHARRFGKSQAAGMLDAYYSVGSNSRALFEHFKIAQEPNWDRHLNKYNVVHVDMSEVIDSYQENFIDGFKQDLYDEFKVCYPDLNYSKPISTILLQVYELSARKFVIIIDEWDCVVRNMASDGKLVHRYMQFLHEIFKSETSKKFLALGYITGILPIKKIKDESALNNFSEYTMMDSGRLAQFYGFKEEEVQQLCAQYGLDFASVKEWYNGYLLNGEHMYNPNSVYRCLEEGQLKSYWKNTSAYDSINTFITRNFDGLKDAILKMLDGDKVLVNVGSFKNDLEEIHSKDDALTALINLGYLAYDSLRKQAYIPNYEVKTAFRDALTTGKWQDIKAILDRCDELLTATWDQDSDKVAEIVELAHQNHASIVQYNNENALSCVVTMAYFTAPAYYTVVRELPAGKGFADLVFIPRNDSGNIPAFIVELKWDQCANTALKQIQERNYPQVLQGYHGQLLLVGISYNNDVKSKDYKKHSCKIEAVNL